MEKTVLLYVADTRAKESRAAKWLQVELMRHGWISTRQRQLISTNWQPEEGSGIQTKTKNLEFGEKTYFGKKHTQNNNNNNEDKKKTIWRHFNVKNSDFQQIVKLIN